MSGDLSHASLLELSLRQGGFDDDDGGKTQGFRQRAWLQLLDLSYLEASLTSAAPLDGNTAPLSAAQPRNDGHHQRTASPSGITGGASSVPVDSDGWQIANKIDRECKDLGKAATSSDDDFLDASATSTAKAKPVDEWTVATSRRHVRRRQNAHGSESVTNKTADGSEDAVLVDKQSSRSTEGESRNGSLLRGEDRNMFTPTLTADTSTVRKEERRARKKQKKKKGGKRGNISDAASGSRAPQIHRDEQQVALDVRRSFIRLGDTPLRQRRREQLTYVIRTVLRRYPDLNYYQGYHDVVAVLLVVLIPDAMATPVPEKEGGDSASSHTRTEIVATASLDAVVDVLSRMSLHMLRDGMARDMTPTLGHLKVLQAILKACGSTHVNASVGAAGPLPYFALPWLLSLFAHDVDERIAQLIFDYVLARGPASVICFSAALIAHFANELSASDAAEMHHTLAQLPTKITLYNLGAIERSADDVARKVELNTWEQKSSNGASPAFGRHIMGPQSVLYSWRALPWSKQSGTINAGPAEEAWRRVNDGAQAVLMGNVSAIVIDALPTPPPSPSSTPSDAFIDGGGALKALSRYRRRGRGRSSGGDGKDSGHDNGANTSLALFGAVGAVGMALLLVYSGTAGGAASSGTGMVNSVVGRDAAVALLRSSESLRQLFRQALQH